MQQKRQNRNLAARMISLILSVLLFGYVFADASGIISDPLHILKKDTRVHSTSNTITDYSNTATSVNDVSIPAFDGNSDAYVLNGDTPFFTGEELVYTETYTDFSELDSLGRAGAADAVLGKETMQTHDRGSISDIHPSGWWEAKQTDVNVNRSHLIGNQLAGDITDCAENMITGSRQLNAGGKYEGSMLVYENAVADYMKSTGNHVRYRVSPVFENNDCTPKGVLMEAESIEDKGRGLKFCVYIYNVQDGYECDYQTGLWEKVTTAEVHESARNQK